MVDSVKLQTESWGINYHTTEFLEGLRDWVGVTPLICLPTVDEQLAKQPPPAMQALRFVTGAGGRFLPFTSADIVAPGERLIARGRPQFAPCAARVDACSSADYLTLAPIVSSAPMTPVFEPLTPTDDAPANLARLVDRAREAGLLGMGGAGFPTWRKLDSLDATAAMVIVINAVECEPGLASDAALWRERHHEIATLVAWLHANFASLRVDLAVKHDFDVADDVAQCARVVRVPDRYPYGDERILHRAISSEPDRRPRGRPSDDNILVINVATLFALYDASVVGRPPTSRWVTLLRGGSAPMVAKVMFGTPLLSMSTSAPGAVEPSLIRRISVGGPFMHQPCNPDNAIVTPMTTGVVVELHEAPSVAGKARQLACIGCGYCEPVCPQHLPVQQLYHAAAARQIDELARLGVNDCSGCTCCDLVCPSAIPLARQLRAAATEVARSDAAERAADVAKARADRHLMREQSRAESRVEKRSAAKSRAPASGAQRRKNLDAILARARSRDGDGAA